MQILAHFHPCEAAATNESRDGTSIRAPRDVFSSNSVDAEETEITSTQKGSVRMPVDRLLKGLSKHHLLMQQYPFAKNPAITDIATEMNSSTTTTGIGHPARRSTTPVVVETGTVSNRRSSARGNVESIGVSTYAVNLWMLDLVTNGRQDTTSTPQEDSVCHSTTADARVRVTDLQQSKSARLSVLDMRSHHQMTGVRNKFILLLSVLL